MENKITFEKISKRRNIYGKTYNADEVTLRINGQIFDINRATKHSKMVQNVIRERYFNALEGLYLPGHVVVVRLNGIHFQIEDVEKYRSFVLKDHKLEMIFHYLEWKDRGGGHICDAFAIMEVNKKLLRQMLHEFWFALGFELQFEGIVLPPDKVYDIERWSRRVENRKTHSDLINMASLIFDNQHNGFHFKVISNEKYGEVVYRILSKFHGFNVK